MSVYEKLLLNAGGGIVYTGKQLEQVKDTVTILIGLGGTGVDAIRRIKTEVYSRLRPDNEDPIRPEYKHIKFLGIDADKNATGIKKDDKRLLCLDDTEFLQLRDSGKIKAAFHGEATLENRKDLEWLKYKNIPYSFFSEAGACRQYGRYLFFEQVDDFITKINNLLIKEDITSQHTSSSIQIHIFSGVCGGTGSGIFLDICYLLRNCLANEQAAMFGYVFLPDVNMSRVQGEINQEALAINGYATMQEIDYCMQLPGNGGSFKQVYRGVGSVDWNMPPVDMCHLIGGEHELGSIPKNPYEYAMHVVTEYVIDFLTQPEEDDCFGIVPHKVKVFDKINTIDGKKNHGVNVRYATFGAASAVMPYKLMNTYLASKFFEAFKDIKDKKPDDIAAKEFAMNVIGNFNGNFNKLYEKLYNRIKGEVSIDFDEFPYDWKCIKKHGDHALIAHYAGQKEIKIADVKTNAEALMGEGNLSLKVLLKKYMTEAICDPNRGPFYALGYIDKSQATNLINIIDGLIEGNKKKRLQYLYNNNEVDKRYRDDRKEFFDKINRHFVNHKKLINNLEDSLWALTQYEIQIYIYYKIEEVLIKFEEGIKNVVFYYNTFKEVISDLMDTFDQNLRDINGDLIEEDPFTILMIDIKDKKFMQYLNTKVAEVNPINQVSSLMQLLLDNDDKWKENDLETELNVSELIVDFFTNQMFSNFAKQTFDQLLAQKYGTSNSQTLINNIKKEYMDELVTKATPMFKPNSLGTGISNCKISYISVPNVSALIGKAASEEVAKFDDGRNNVWNVKNTALSDRISIMTIKVGLPMGSYWLTEEIEKSYEKKHLNGLPIHCYEGYPNYNLNKISYHLNGMLCDDWRKMGSLIPYSYRAIDNVPSGIKEILEHNSNIFDQAVELEIIQQDGEIKRLDSNKKREILNKVKTINKLIEKIENKVQYYEVEKSFKEFVGNELQYYKVKVIFKELEDHLRIITTSDNYISTPHTKLSTIGRIDTHLSAEEVKVQTYRLMKDYFVNAIEQVEIVKSYVNEVNELKDAVKEVQNRINKIKEK